MNSQTELWQRYKTLYENSLDEIRAWEKKYEELKKEEVPKNAPAKIKSLEELVSVQEQALTTKNSDSVRMLLKKWRQEVFKLMTQQKSDQLGNVKKEKDSEAKIKEFQEEIQSLQAENEFYEKRIKLAEDEKSKALKEQAEEFKNLCNDYRSKIYNLKESLENKESEINEYQHIINQERQKYALLEQNMNQVQRSLSKELDKVRHFKQSFQNIKTQCENEKKDLQLYYQSELDSVIQQENAKYKELRKQHLQLLNKFQNLEKTSIEERERNDSQEKELRDYYESKLQSQTEELSQLKRERHQLLLSIRRQQSDLEQNRNSFQKKNVVSRIERISKMAENLSDTESDSD
eukprot:gb/GECH01007590.1/.p1 GENE.gb/GECH01007590.1/~~gb/GECH01007590.1/.p1  ORF type:complete len:348 (+),score=106.45 gb/GECH01007590.1/:1-1044(+)